MSINKTEMLKLTFWEDEETGDLLWMFSRRDPLESCKDHVRLHRCRYRLNKALEAISGHKFLKADDCPLFEYDSEMLNTCFEVRRYRGNQKVALSFSIKRSPEGTSELGVLSINPESSGLSWGQAVWIVKFAIAYYVQQSNEITSSAEKLSSSFIFFNMLGDEEAPNDYFLIEPWMYTQNKRRKMTYEDVWSWTCGPNSKITP